MTLNRARTSGYDYLPVGAASWSPFRNLRHPHLAQPLRARVPQCRGDFSNPQAAYHRRTALLGIHGRHRRRDHPCRGHTRRNRLDAHRSPRRPQQHVGRHGGRTGHAGGLDPRQPRTRPQEARPAPLAPPHRGAGGHVEAVPPVVSHRPHWPGRRRRGTPSRPSSHRRSARTGAGTSKAAPSRRSSSQGAMSKRDRARAADVRRRRQDREGGPSH